MKRKDNEYSYIQPQVDNKRKKKKRKKKKGGFGKVLLVIIALLVIATAFIVSHNGFTVKFDTDGGSHIDSVKVMHSETVGVSENPVKEGYAFTGWYTGISYSTIAEPSKIYNIDDKGILNCCRGNDFSAGKDLNTGEKLSLPSGKVISR